MQRAAAVARCIHLAMKKERKKRKGERGRGRGRGGEKRKVRQRLKFPAALHIQCSRQRRLQIMKI